jgi:signal transduction histidine kinase
VSEPSGSLQGDRRHELKNQLGIVLGFTELLLTEMEQDDPWRADVAEIRAAAARALELVNEGGQSDA